jgi:large conductance mechanosensitive channel
MAVIKDFKEFALKGNVIDLAIAVIIGAAFGTIVSSLVDDVITPLLLTPVLEASHADNLDQLAWGAVKYGRFLAAAIKFLLIACVLFVLIQGINRLKRRRENAVTDAAPVYTLQEKLLMEIRDSLKGSGNK